MAGKFEIKTGKNGKVHFNLKASNGSVVLRSDQYETATAAQSAIKAVRENAANDHRFERRTTKDGSVYFVLKAKNGEIVGKSDQYSSKTGMEKGISSVRTNAESAKIVLPKRS